MSVHHDVSLIKLSALEVLVITKGICPRCHTKTLKSVQLLNVKCSDAKQCICCRRVFGTPDEKPDNARP